MRTTVLYDVVACERDCAPRFRKSTSRCKNCALEKPQKNTGFRKSRHSGEYLANYWGMVSHHFRGLLAVVLGGLLAAVPTVHSQNASAAENDYEFNDAHFHLTNYVQEGTPIRDFLKIMGTITARSILFGIPLQQQWSYRVSGDKAPTHYLDSDAPLYYYSFTDAYIATAYLSLSPQERKRFDPLITGSIPPTCTRRITSAAYCTHFLGCSAGRRIHYSQGVRFGQGRRRRCNTTSVVRKA